MSGKTEVIHPQQIYVRTYLAWVQFVLYLSKLIAGRCQYLTRQMPDKSKQGNGAKPPRGRKPAAPKLPEKTKKLTLKAFRLAYEAHHPKSS